MQHPMLPGAWGEQPHKPKPPHSKIFTLFSKNHFRRILCPKGHPLGLNALRLRGGMGAAQAPIEGGICCEGAEGLCRVRGEYAEAVAECRLLFYCFSGRDVLLLWGFAGVIQWQNRSFPCFLRGFDSLRPLHFGLLAQLVRALPSHGRGRWFESSTAHHFGGFLSETAFLF